MNMNNALNTTQPEEASSINNMEIIHHKPKNENKEIAQKVEKIAWIIEGCVITFGVSVSTGLTFPDFPNDLNLSISSLISFGFFFMLAISEASKIPLSQVFVASSSLKLRISALLALLAVLTISVDNLITGGDVVQKQRLQPILEKKKQIEERQNNLTSIQSKIASISMEIPNSVKNLVTQSDEEIVKKTKAIENLRQEIKSISLSNNFLLKGSINAEVDINKSQIKELKDLIVSQKQDLFNEIDELNKQKFAEMDRSLLRDGAISKKYDQKILIKESSFAKEKSLIDLTIGKKQSLLNALYIQRRDANKLSSANKSRIDELMQNIRNIQEEIVLADNTRKDSISKSINLKELKEENKESLIHDASTIESALINSKMQLDHLMRENFIYRIASYIFTKNPTDITDEEYGLINLIFIFSIAIGLSILPSFLAGISSSLKMENKIKIPPSENMEKIFKVINSLQKIREERRDKKHDGKMIQTEEELKQVTEELKQAKEELKQADAKSRKCTQEDLEKEKKYRSRIKQLEEELTVKPKVVEKEVTQFVDRPFYQPIPVPLSESNTASLDFLKSLKSYFNNENNEKNENGRKYAKE